MFKFKTIRKKIITYLVTLLAAIFLLLTFFVNINTSKSFFELTEDLLLELVEAKSEEIGQWVLSRVEDLQILIDKRNVKSGDWEIMREDIYIAFEKRKDIYEMIFWADLNGDFNTTGEITGSIAEREYFRKIIYEGHDYVVSNAKYSKSTNEKIVVIAHSVKNEQNELVGLLGATVDLKRFNSKISEIKPKVGGYAWISDGLGYFIAHIDKSFIMNKNIFDFIDEKDYDVSLKKVSLNLQDSHIFSAVISNTPNWILGFTLENKEVMSGVNRLTLIILTIMLLAFIITIIILIFLSDSISSPLIILKEKIEKFSLGDEKVEFEIKRKDEINLISKELDIMKESIISQRNQIVNANEEIMALNEELEATNEELEASNEQLRANNQELEESYIQISDLSNKFEKIIDLTAEKLFNLDMSQKEFFDELMDSSLAIIPEADYGSVALINENKNFKFISSVGHDVEALNKIKFTEKDMVSAREIKYIAHENLEKDFKNMIDNSTKRIRKSMISSIWDEETVVGNIGIDISFESKEDFSKSSEKALKALANIASAYITFRNYLEVKHDYLNDMVMTMVNMLEIYDKYTQGHSKNVAELSVKMAKLMNVKTEECEKLYWAGIMHDIGKLFIPESILNKPDKLTLQEFEIMKKHAQYGYEAVSRSKKLEEVGKIILSHHERYDGKGYPNNLKGEEIPLFSRIISVADSYDTMISKRTYKNIRTKEEAIKEVKFESGKQFDPQIVKVFLQMMNKNSEG